MDELQSSKKRTGTYNTGEPATDQPIVDEVSSTSDTKAGVYDRPAGARTPGRRPKTGLILGIVILIAILIALFAL